MTTISPKIQVKSYPNPLSIFFGFIGAIFFGLMAYLTYNTQYTAKNKIDTQTEIILLYSILGIFIFFCFWSLTLILKAKIITLTKQDLIVQQPFLFIKKIVPLNNINEIYESEFKVNPRIKNSTYNIHNGKQCTLKLSNGKQIKFNSFELIEYQDLYKKLLISINRTTENTNSINIKNEGWGILIIIALISLGLAASIILK